MIRLTTALLTLGVSIASATTALAQSQDGCFYGSCNPEASWCRLLCGSDPQQQNVRSQPGYMAVARTCTKSAKEGRLLLEKAQAQTPAYTIGRLF
jgi:hypothetical protein